MMHSMFPIIPLATDPGDLRPVESLALTTPLVVAIVACLLLAVGLIALIIMLSRPARKPRNSDRARGAHSNASSKAEWRARIDDVVARHESGALPRHEAFVELSVIARDFAGAASGKELSSSTLTDLAYLNRTPANRQGLDALKQTIGALYPPEFADDARTESPRRPACSRPPSGWRIWWKGGVHDAGMALALGRSGRRLGDAGDYRADCRVRPP